MAEIQACIAGLRLVLVCSLVFNPAWGATDDLAGVGRILGDKSESLPGMQTLATGEKAFDQLAREATRHLGQGNRDWKPSNPQWTGVYKRVRADLEAEKAQITSDLDAARQATQTQLVTAVAAELSPADLKTILAYYDSPEGRRYEAFMRRVDAIMATAVPGPGFRGTLPVAQPPPENEMRDYLQMLLLSRVMQAGIAAQPAVIAAHGDPSGLSGLGFVPGFAIRFHSAEVAALYGEYKADLPQFAAFDKTAAAQQLFRAMGAAIFLAKPPLSQPMTDAFAAVEHRHEKDWQALYLAETGR